MKNFHLGILSLNRLSSYKKYAQQSVHLTLGILAKISSIFHALLFSWLDVSPSQPTRR